MACLERGARNASRAHERAFGFSLDCASRAAAHRTATPAASPSERTEGTPAVYSSSERVWRNYRSDASLSWRARDYRPKLASAPLQLQGAAFHDQSGSTLRKM